MSDAKHTPLKVVPDGFGAADIYDANDMPVACDVDQDRAFLFAAAPDLLEIADSAPIVSAFHNKRGFDVEGFLTAYEEWKAKARAALAKAKGGAS